MRKEEKWKANEIKILTEYYPTHNCSQIAEILNRSKISVESKAFRLKLKKPPEWYSNPNAKRFVPGHTKRDGYQPHNKGKKRSEWMTEDQIEKIKKTQFKKGRKPDHAVEIGSIIIRMNQYKKSYKWIKISKKEWIPLHHKIWQDTYGDIPDQYVVKFKDGNSMNVVIENLEIITKSELVEINRDSKYPMELRELIRMNNKLKKAVWQKTKSLI